jgi:GNAT superfamily N-acetyltransferase
VATHLTNLGVVVMANDHPDFYPTLGPFLARREIERELGARLYDEDGKRWFAAMVDGNVVGFAAATWNPRTKRVTFQHAYVLPGHRRQGVYRLLFDTRLGYYGGRSIQATCTESSLPMFRTHGFVERRRRGRFVEVHRD